MNTGELLAILGRICKGKGVAHDVIPSDYLVEYSRSPYPVALIVNSKDSSHPGQHWLAILSRDRTVYFFCSYGMGIEFYGKYFEEFAKDKLVIQNNVALQSPNSVVCGKYALYFISKLIKGKNLSSIYCGFSKDCRKNDAIVEKFVNRHKPILCNHMPKCKIQYAINSV